MKRRTPPTLLAALCALWLATEATSQSGATAQPVAQGWQGWQAISAALELRDARTVSSIESGGELRIEPGGLGAMGFLGGETVVIIYDPATRTLQQRRGDRRSATTFDTHGCPLLERRSQPGRTDVTVQSRCDVQGRVVWRHTDGDPLPGSVLTETISYSGRERRVQAEQRVPGEAMIREKIYQGYDPLGAIESQVDSLWRRISERVYDARGNWTSRLDSVLPRYESSFRPLFQRAQSRRISYR